MKSSGGGGWMGVGEGVDVSGQWAVFTIEDAVGHSATGGDRESVLVFCEGVAVWTGVLCQQKRTFHIISDLSWSLVLCCFALFFAWSRKCWSELVIFFQNDAICRRKWCSQQHKVMHWHSSWELPLSFSFCLPFVCRLWSPCICGGSGGSFLGHNRRRRLPGTTASVSGLVWVL